MPKRPTHDDFVKKAFKDPAVKQHYNELKQAYNLGQKLAKKSQKQPMSRMEYITLATIANVIGIVIGNVIVTIAKYYLVGQIL